MKIRREGTLSIAWMNAFMMASLFCVFLLRPLGNPAVMYADVTKNPISEISLWDPRALRCDETGLF